GALAGNNAGNSPAKAKDSGNFYTGFNSMSISTNADQNEGVKQGVTMVNGTGYTFSFYAKAQGSNFSTLSFGRTDNGASQANDTDCATNQTVVTTGWTYFSCNFTAGAQSNSPYVYIK